MSNKKPISIIVLCLQIFFLSAMVFYHHAKLRNADRVLLKTVPCDPLSIFRGSYASLRYEISTLPVSLLRDTNQQKLKNGDELFVLLIKDQDYWVAKGIYKSRPQDKQIYLRGRLRDYYSYYSTTPRDNLNLEYGIESFFLSEERAKEVDRRSRWQRRDWQETERERLSQLDEETRRIYQDRIDKWWVEKLNKEMLIWLKEGLINQTAKDAICNKYALALEKIEKISSPGTAQEKPIIVEVAIDRNGNGYPLKLLIDSKEYR